MDDIRKINSYPPRQSRGSQYEQPILRSPDRSHRPIEPRKPHKPKVFRYIIIAIILFIGGLAGYQWYIIRELKSKDGINTTATATSKEKEIQDIIAKVSQIFVVPENETPEVITISDTALINSHPFFTKAKIGDKVLIYPKAKKAILYDPINNKIVDVAQLNVGTTP